MGEWDGTGWDRSKAAALWSKEVLGQQPLCLMAKGILGQLLAADQATIYCTGAQTCMEQIWS